MKPMLRQAMLMQTIHTDWCKTNAIQHICKRVTTVIGNLEGMEVFFDMESLSQFDVVILAAPIQQSWIAFLIWIDKDSAALHDMPLFVDMIDMEEREVEDLHNLRPTKLPDSMTWPYTQVVTTVVSNATLDAHHFYLNMEDLPRGIYMTENGNARNMASPRLVKSRQMESTRSLAANHWTKQLLKFYSSQVMRLFTSRFGVGCMEVLLLTTEAKERQANTYFMRALQEWMGTLGVHCTIQMPLRLCLPAWN